MNSSLGNSGNGISRSQTIRIIQSTVASVGIVANLTVVVVLLNNKKLREKIPNVFIINQVRRKCTVQCIMLKCHLFSMLYIWNICN